MRRPWDIPDDFPHDHEIGRELRQYPQDEKQRIDKEVYMGITKFYGCLQMKEPPTPKFEPGFYRGVQIKSPPCIKAPPLCIPEIMPSIKNAPPVPTVKASPRGKNCGGIPTDRALSQGGAPKPPAPKVVAPKPPPPIPLALQNIPPPPTMPAPRLTEDDAWWSLADDLRECGLSGHNMSTEWWKLAEGDE